MTRATLITRKKTTRNKKVFISLWYSIVSFFSRLVSFSFIPPAQRINVALTVRQSIFIIIVGRLLFRLQITWLDILGVVVAGFVLEHILLFIKERKLDGWSFSSLNTSLSTAIMLGTTNWFVYLAGLTVGLVQKHIIRIDSKHFLNPSNVAIVFALLFFPNDTFALFTPLGVTSLWWVAILVALSAFLIVSKARLVIIPLTYAVWYALFAYMFVTRNVFEIATFMESGNFILFAFYMLADPKAIPFTNLFRILFAVIAAFGAHSLTALWGMKYVNPFLALFIAELFVPIFRRIEHQSTTVRFRYLFVSVIVVVLSVLTLMLYVSPYNIARNLARITSSQEAGTVDIPIREEKIISPDPNLWRELWSHTDTDLFAPAWNVPHMVTRPFKKEASTGFLSVRTDSAFSSYVPTLTRADLGGEYFPYAAATAGDINHDGYMDVVLAKVRQKLRVYINDRKGDFVDGTASIFEDAIPEDVEQVVLADFNNDTWLDLLVVYSEYRGPKANALYFFMPSTHTFHKVNMPFGKGKRSSGGVTLWDINKDKKLDFYISYGIDWLSEKGTYQQYPFPDELYVSNGSTWADSMAHYFPKELALSSYIGMTPLFTDFTQDGNPDFLLGNDSSDPSFTLIGKPDASFVLIDKQKIEQNTRSSMSYFSDDFDSDGVMELFEAGITFKMNEERKSAIVSADSALGGIFGARSIGQQAVSVDQFQKSAKDIELGIFHCEQFTNPYVAATCLDKRLTMGAIQSNNSLLCDSIVGRGERAMCKREVGILNRQNLPNPLLLRYDPEKFAKKLSINTLLHYDTASDRWRQGKINDEIAYTNWTWTAYPYDVNNDGYLDIYLTSGAVFYSHDYGNKLLINTATPGAFFFQDQTGKIDTVINDDSRGVIIADFQNNGSGDIVVNNFLASPVYVNNHFGGNSIEMELRSKNSNYYAIGARIELVTNQEKQVREIREGGIWQSAQPSVVHFGIAPTDAIKYAIIYWPDGHTERIDKLIINNKYIVYE